MADFNRAAASPPKIDASPIVTHRAPRPFQLGHTTGLVGAAPRTPPPLLPSGKQHLTLPGWRPLAGPMVVPIVGNGVLSTLTGMGEAATIVEVPPLVGAIILLIALGANAIATSANDVASPVGTRFASLVNIGAGRSAPFVCAIDHDGHKKWFAVVAATAL